jgi:uncharacterized YkwD family protein
MFVSSRNRKMLLVFIISLCLMLGQASAAYAFGKGAQGPDVYAVQAMLKSMGYFNGKITGYYGTQTEAAVRLFQQKYGLPATGAVDDRTLESILWAYASTKIPKKPTPTPAPTPAPVPEPAPTPVPAPNPKPPATPGLTADEQRMIELVNAERGKAGLTPLIADLELSQVARLKSQDMIANNYFSHDSPTYGSPFDMMKQFGISYTAAGENIACNQTVEKAHEALMNSSGHRANILSQNFTHIGIGIVDGGPCGKMFTQMFIRK